MHETDEQDSVNLCDHLNVDLYMCVCVCVFCTTQKCCFAKSEDMFTCGFSFFLCNSVERLHSKI